MRHSWPMCLGLDTTLFLWEAVLRDSPTWGSLLPLPGPPGLPGGACPQDCSHQLCDCWALGVPQMLQREPQEGGEAHAAWSHSTRGRGL